MDEKILKEAGFKNQQEFFKMVSLVDLSSPEKVEAFERWKKEDGTKAGLLKLNAL